jgi:histidinol phosphatase-like enzyme
VGIVSNQSGIARGRLTPEAVDAVNARVAELLGPFDVVTYCPHGPGDGCACRKPAPGLVRRAAAVLRVEAADCVVIGDIGADVGAARAAGARGILVPTARTRPEEVLEAREVASDVLEAVELALGTPAAPGPEPVLSVPSDPRATVAA